ncbi:MAG: hypothetical protein KC917_09910 [Candidatus Omnitrophica bacterium]|nr:hypothetical protein [Candidatus Omnitrophota bacterium]MCA9416577.1 hypothetical protein [Candidatus Omnitrophota bacterium]MCA9426062.1 hypothetical protein [Candidatus Omnitrophota bacterium]MCA9432538.1 hypothetical protein [Candidatus Omnitrophota bacterium]MCA9434276.1 hypothetical protein [Candidatus Omnitrophota bacterium]
MSIKIRMRHTCCLLLFAIISLPISPALGISRTDFFERLEESMNRVQTFTSDIQQESRYRDGLVQRYSGRLTLFSDGKISYIYDLVGEYEDPSLVPESEINSQLTEGAAPKVERAPSSGRIFAKGGSVLQYDADRDLLVQGKEDENLLVQVFRALLGSGDFDIEKFKDEHSIDVDETTLDGMPVYRMVASPKRRSELFKIWSSQTRNEMMNWDWELWVRQSDMLPLRAILQSKDESTAVHLIGAKVNGPVDESDALLPAGANPRAISKQGFGTTPSRKIDEIRSLEPEPAGLQEIPTE